MEERSRIYVDAESLFDIRQAILSKLMDQDSLLDFINSEEYNFRNTDNFPRVDMAQYEKIHKEASLDLLPRSTITFILNVIKTKLLNLERRNALYGEAKRPEVVLNIHPFKLTQAQADTIQNLLFIKLNSSCYISIIDKPIEEISPHFIKNSNYTACFIYNAPRWIELHTDSLNKIKLQDSLIYFPALYRVEAEEKELERIRKLGFKDVFSYLEFLLSSAVSINFLPVVFYSNIITSSVLIDKYNDSLKNTSLGEKNGDIRDEI